ncbi:TPA: DNA repair protein RecO [Mannheimia haemolytica]|uniref:DNA repair protein RecO n=2 Tax=Mannheimia TaxID=75984 RepID=A0A7H8UWW2_9PAST|nr:MULTISPECIES: DNA repair protein RecO [Mannheimia]AGQ37997.1 DNA repair protein RecO [Mannheimia haemolytica D171]EEY11045.1 DNA recombination protein RecO [Mannheimia haemolytica serotype A2 str. OVINE]EEY13756.1 DNA recombination protein RecO [Mannheimia haemolytica serotype A2 str. BOVINE]KYL19133.1 DNA repair protein RecO [Mannheimia haemolytica]KYL24100.1 DNA repair protein RecO [Mannheimia haemolytica]
MTTDQWQRAFVLHRREYSESSLLVEFFTEHHGRITLLAKGARRARSPLKAVLQPFTPLLVRWSGKGDLKTLTKAEPAALTLPMETAALYSGFYINEVLARVLENQTAYPELFQHYLRCMTELATQHQIEPILRTFEFHTLKALGYGVDFTHCTATGLPIDPKMSYQFRESEGFIASLLQNNNSFLGCDLLAFAQLDFSEKQTQQAAKRFTRIALKPYLGSQPLKSRELFQSILPNKVKSG